MNANLLELFLGERSGFRQDVLGDGKLPDVVEQCGGLDALHIGIGEPQHACHACGVRLHAAYMSLRHLILRVDCARERLDRRQVQIRGLLHVPLLVLDAAHVDLVRAVREV